MRHATASTPSPSVFVPERSGRVTLGGELRDSGPSTREALVGPRRRALVSGRFDARLSVAFLVAGIGFLTIANAAWAHAIGVACFFGFILSGYQAALPPDVVAAD